MTSDDGLLETARALNEATGYAAKLAEGAAIAARAERAHAAMMAAEKVAAEAARTAVAVQAHADDLAATVASAAAAAARMVAASVAIGGEVDAAHTALGVNATVLEAAAARSEETARAARLVGLAVTAAAHEIAEAAATSAAAAHEAVVDAAVAVRAVAAAAAQQFDNDSRDWVATRTLLAREAALASERLTEQNRDLVQAGLHDRAVAVALQSAMLTRLPNTADIELAARYLTAVELDQVGGDWYDAVKRPDGSTALVIGDVVGHDMAAAAVMGQLRNMLRALVWDRDEPPSAVVARLDRAIRDLGVNTLATLVLAILEPPTSACSDARSLRWSNAGHPAPIVVTADGSTRLIDDSTDVLLGVRPEAARTDLGDTVQSGATLLMYTDGLIETRTESITSGQDRLLAAARRHYRRSLGDFLDRVLADMVGDTPDDDVAVLGVRIN